MSQTLIRGGHDSADSGLRHSAVVRSFSASALLKPALVLVFLLAIAGFTAAAAAKKSSQGNSEVPAVVHGKEASSNLDAAKNEAGAETKSVTDTTIANDSTSDATSNTDSVKVESTTRNGVSSTRLEVNGREIPVQPNSTTQVNLHNGNQSVTSVTTQNTQTSDNGSAFNSTISSSFSHNVNSQTVVGGD